MTRLASGALVACGLVALASLGPAAAALAGLASAACLGAPVLRALPLSWGHAVALPAVAASAAWGAPGELVLAGLLAWLTVHRIGSRPLGDDRIPVALSTLSVLVVAARVTGPAALLPIAAHGVLLPIALLPPTARPRTVLAFGSASSVLALGLFLATPRLLSAETPDRTGFSERVELGELDRLLDDPALVFRARVVPAPSEPMFWRGVALDVFDGRRWTAGGTPLPTEVGGPRTLPPQAHVIEVEAVDRGPVLFTAGRVIDLVAEGSPLVSDGLGGYRAADPGRWRMVSLPPLGPTAAPSAREVPADLERARALPPDLDPRVGPLAAGVAGEGSPTEQVARLADWLRAEFRYTRRPADRGDEAPLATFLFDARAGHCEYFASALAVLARSRGIPARVVNGFAGGEVSPRDGWIEVHRYHAHAWTEVWLDGWVVVDATPGPGRVPAPPLELPDLASFARDVTAYDRDTQLRAVFAASRLLEGGGARLPWRGLSALAAVVVAGAWLARRFVRRTVERVVEPPRRTDPVSRAHAAARAALAAQGLRPPPGLPPVAAAAWIAERRPGPPAEALVSLAWLLYDVELGGADPRAAAPTARALQAAVVEGTTPPR